MSDSRIRVTIHDTIRGEHVGWGLSRTALIRDLIEVVVSMRGLPRFDVDAGPITYNLRKGATGEALEGGRRLADYGITEGEVLELESPRGGNYMEVGAGTSGGIGRRDCSTGLG